MLFQSVFVFAAVLPAVIASHGAPARLNHAKRQFSIIQDPTDGGPAPTETLGFPDRPTPTASLTAPTFPPNPASSRSPRPIPGDSNFGNGSTVLATTSSRFVPSSSSLPTPPASVTPTSTTTPTIMIPETSTPATVTSTVSVIVVATPAPVVSTEMGGSLLQSMGLAPALGFILKLKRSLLEPHFGSSASFTEDNVGYIGVAST